MPQSLEGSNQAIKTQRGAAILRGSTPIKYTGKENKIRKKTYKEAELYLLRARQRFLLKLLCTTPLAIENNILRFTLSRFLLKGRGTTTTFKNYGNLFTKEDAPYSRIDYGLSQDRNSIAKAKSLEAKTIKVTANVRGAGRKVIIAIQIQATPGVFTLTRNVLFEANVNSEWFSTTILPDFSQNETCVVLCTVFNAQFSLLLEEKF